MKKNIKIKICGYNPNDSDSYGALLIAMLEKYYTVTISECPDYIFYDESTYEYLNYPDAIRIWYTGENVHPNFNLCDYAIGFDIMSFEDRYYRFPLYLAYSYFDERNASYTGDIITKQPAPMTQQELDKKQNFCSFVYSNYLADPLRTKLYNLLSHYKKINSGGRYMNNVGGPVASKIDFELSHKFSIAFENSSRNGYTTEKILGSLSARTIPIYWGNPQIHKEFNEKRFINGHRYESFEKIVERVREIDADDNLYISIINEPIFADGFDPQKVYDGLEHFLQNIFNQPLADARRIRINTARAEVLEKNERIISLYTRIRIRIRSTLAIFYQPIKRIDFLHTLRIKFSQNRLHQ